MFRRPYMSLSLDTQTANPVSSCQILPHSPRLLGNLPIYVKRYARTIHGAFVKSFKSCEIVTSEVETMEVSRLEKRSPISNLEPSVSSDSDKFPSHLRYDKNCPSRPSDRVLPQADDSRRNWCTLFFHILHHCHLAQRRVRIGK